MIRTCPKPGEACAYGKCGLYIARIKHPAKKRYAAPYARSMEYGGCFPARPADLSVMAAQAVRMTIREFYGYEPGE